MADTLHPEISFGERREEPIGPRCELVRNVSTQLQSTVGHQNVVGESARGASGEDSDGPLARRKRFAFRCGSFQPKDKKRLNRFTKTGPGGKNVRPRKFLLGGNITDPLNLNSLYDDEVGRLLNEKTPQSSPLPLPEYKNQVEVLIPPNINDPLNLQGNPLQPSSKTNSAKKKKNKHKKKRPIGEIGKTISDDQKQTDDVSGVLSSSEDDSSDEKTETDQHSPSKPVKPAAECPAKKPRLSGEFQGKRHSLDQPPTTKGAKVLKVETETCPKPQTDISTVSPAIKPENQPSTSRELSKDRSKPSKNKFLYGNYTRYYGYRNPSLEPDQRLECFQPEWFRERDVLDIGCNIGHVTLTVARDFNPSKIVGIDIDSKLVTIAKKNIRYYMTLPSEEEGKFPKSLPATYGPLGAPSTFKVFPHNVMFMHGNYVLDTDEELDLVQEEYDTILALSVTKWIHLNFGDRGLKRVFKRMHKHLRPGGKLVLEPQPWSSYKKKKKISEAISKNFQQIRLRPEQFTEYLLSREVGFVACEHVSTPYNKSRGFQRPIQVYTKSESHTTPVEDVTPLMAIDCTPSGTPQIYGTPYKDPVPDSTWGGTPGHGTPGSTTS